MVVGEEGPGQNKSSKKEKSALKRIYWSQNHFFFMKKKGELNKGNVALD